MQREITPGREAQYRPDDQREGFADLLRELAGQSAALVRQEANLARLEMKETATAIGGDAVKIGIALGIAAAGGLALTAFLVLVIGNLLDGAYWAGALIVGVVLLLIGGLLAKRAVSNLKHIEVKPEETIDSLNEDRRWLQREARDFRRETLS
ncbi:MAG TPA: phage holin family protein [Longimicrobiales bacterium]